MHRRFLLAAGFAALTPGLVFAQHEDDKHGGGGGKPGGGGGGGERPGGGRPAGPPPQGGGRPAMGGARPAIENRPAPGGQQGFNRPQTSRPAQQGFNRPAASQQGGRPGAGGRPNWGGRPPFGGRPVGQRPPGFRPIQGRAFRYPSGYGYRRWGIGVALPLLFLSSAYYFNDYASYGVYAPPYGYRWVRYGPDLLLVQLGTGYVADAIYGAFY